MTSCLPLPPLRMTRTTGLRAIPQGAWAPFSRQWGRPGGEPDLRWGPAPRGRLSPARQVGVMTPGSASPLLATRLGVPRTGRAQGPATGAHGESAAPRCRRDTQTPGTPRGCQHDPLGRVDLPGPPGLGGGRGEAGAGAARRGGPALSRRRGRSLKGLKDVWGRAARRRMLTPMG